MFYQNVFFFSLISFLHRPGQLNVPLRAVLHEQRGRWQTAAQHPTVRARTARDALDRAPGDCAGSGGVSEELCKLKSSLILNEIV